MKELIVQEMYKKSVKLIVRDVNPAVLFAGHVDAGKSTLMGHLLYRLGDVSKKSMHKYPFTIILWECMIWLAVDFL